MNAVSRPIKWDEFYLRTFNQELYNCLHFASEVWEAMTGENIRELLLAFGAPDQFQQSKRQARKAFEELPQAVSPCIVVMQRRTPARAPHVGIFIRGKVFHMHECGVEYQPLEVAMRGFNQVSYYRPCKR